MPRKHRSFHIDSFTDRLGVKRYYFRKGKGPRIPLPGAPNSAEFEVAYAQALTGAVERRLASGPTAEAPGTIGALIADYKTSEEFRTLRATTKPGYVSRLEAIRKDHGHRSLAGMTREGIEKGILRPLADRPGAALDTIKKLRILIKHAIRIKWLRADPSLGIKRPRNEEIRSWTEEEIAQFEARWPLESKQRLAFALMLYTGQRRSDVHRMTWGDIRDGRISVVQQKTGAKLKILIHSKLATVLAAADRNHVTILNTAYGKPFTVDGFSGFMRDAIHEADLPLDAQPHGLRKAAGRRLAEAGASTRQIMAVLGHQSLSEAERYTRDADQARMADEGISRVAGHTENKSSQTVPMKFGKTGGK